MGFWRSLLGDGKTLHADNQTALLPPIPGDVAQIANLPVSVAAAFGISTDSTTVTRREAIQVPAVSKGRATIAGTLGTIPLIALSTTGGRQQRITRELLTQPDPDVTRAWMLTWTLDDLIFYGVSWWQVLDRDGAGFPRQARRILPGHVSFDQATGQPYIDGQQVRPDDLIRFDGPDEGLLQRGARAIRTAIMLDDAVRNYARLDIPLGYLSDEEGVLTDAEIQAMLDGWEAARAKRSTAYIPRGLSYSNPTFSAEQLQLSDARNHQAAEIARLMNLPPDAINAPSNDSLTYATTEGNRRRLVDETYAAYIAPIEQRLSLDDVTPAGLTVHLDLAEFLRGDLKNVLDAAAVGIAAGVLTVNEVRTEWLKLPPLDGSSDIRKSSAGDSTAKRTQGNSTP